MLLAASFFEGEVSLLHTALYRKWRPADFTSVVGQDHITGVLRYEVAHGKTTHAYLFCGSRGTGKTTCAKILAKAINCLSPVDGNPCGKCEACLAVAAGNATDIIEMDAASNNGVEYIRDIREEVIYTPALLKKKVYIIDEVHMLSASAFNALLKTLEEPPEHVVFILATTELQKLPATITSRCQRFDFRRISTDDIAGRLEFIAGKEDISLTHEAAKLIGRLSLGGMRDAISLLELCAGSGKTVDIALVNSAAGVSGRENVSQTVAAVIKKNNPAIFGIIGDFSSSAVDLLVFWQELISYYRDMLVMRTAPDSIRYLDLTEDEINDVKKNSAAFTRERLLYHIRLLEDAYITMQRSSNLKRVCAEMTLVRMTDDRLSETPDALLSRIAALEEKIAQGVFASPSPSFEAAGEPAEDKPESDSAAAEKIPEPTPEKTHGSGTPIDFWNEVVKSVERSDIGLSFQLRRAKAVISGRRVTINVGDSFSESLINSPGNRDLIAKAISAAGDIPGITGSDISVTVSKEENSGDDPFEGL